MKSFFFRTVSEEPNLPKTCSYWSSRKTDCARELA